MVDFYFIVLFVSSVAAEKDCVHSLKSDIFKQIENWQWLQ